MSAADGPWVSDAIVDLLVDAEIEHIALNPGASFRGLHDSLVNYRDDGPELHLCLHEEIAVAVAHGYAKASGRPMAALLHDMVGLQHASMAVYNAWCDRVPLLALGGTGPVSTVHRRPWIDWIHTAHVQGQQVRDYVKWDDQPADAASIPRSLARAITVSRAAPAGPVYVCLDAGMQEDPLPGGFEWESMASHPVAAAAAPSQSDVRAMADLLRSAKDPLILSDYAGDDPQAFTDLVALAERTEALFLDKGGRLNFPVSHRLNATNRPERWQEADALLALDVDDVYGTARETNARTVIHAGVGHLKLRAWSNDFQELPALDRHITAAAGPTITALLEALSADPVPANVLKSRRTRHDADPAPSLAELRSAAVKESADGKIPIPRLLAELWPLIESRRPVVVHGEPPPWSQERRLWALDAPRTHLGSACGGGLGDACGAAIGAALALRGSNQLCVNLQPDGDLLFTPQALWTTVRAKLPVLTVVLNNREYNNTVNHAARIAEHRGRPVSNRHIGSGLSNPNVDFVGLARSFGMWATGPIADPGDLKVAIESALAEIDAGRPALVEVLTPGS